MPRTPKGEPAKAKMIWARVTEELCDEVHEVAKAEGRTISALVERAVAAYIRAAKRKRP